MPSVTCRFCGLLESHVEHLIGCPEKIFKEAKKAWEEGYSDGQTNSSMKDRDSYPPDYFLTYVLGYFIGAHRRINS